MEGGTFIEGGIGEDKWGGELNISRQVEFSIEPQWQQCGKMKDEAMLLKLTLGFVWNNVGGQSQWE